MENKRRLGNDKEKLVADYIFRMGLTVLDMNFYCRQGEIDIIALDKEYLVFIEVKYRTTKDYGNPSEAVDIRKRKRICKAALYYMYKNGYNESTPVRFDVVSVLKNEVTYIKNAFEYVI